MTMKFAVALYPDIKASETNQHTEVRFAKDKRAVLDEYDRWIEELKSNEGLTFPQAWERLAIIDAHEVGNPNFDANQDGYNCWY